LEPPLIPRPPSPTAPTTTSLRGSGGSHHGGSTGSPPGRFILLVFLMSPDFLIPC